jgi:hypothetical protein
MMEEIVREWPRALLLFLYHGPEWNAMGERDGRTQGRRVRNADAGEERAINGRTRGERCTEYIRRRAKGGGVEGS